MSGPSASSTAVVADQAVLEPFIKLLNSPSHINLPPATLYGAITHFLSTLSAPHLTDFTTAVVSSPSLWNLGSERNDEVRDAIRLSVSAKISQLDQALQKAYFPDSRRQHLARRWLQEVCNAMISAAPSEGRTYALIGLLEGLGDVASINWGQGRVRVEEEVVMCLAEILDGDNGVERSKVGMRLLCAAIMHIGEDRLRALDLKVSPDRSISLSR